MLVVHPSQAWKFAEVEEEEDKGDAQLEEDEEEEEGGGGGAEEKEAEEAEQNDEDVWDELLRARYRGCKNKGQSDICAQDGSCAYAHSNIWGGSSTTAVHAMVCAVNGRSMHILCHLVLCVLDLEWSTESLRCNQFISCLAAKLQLHRHTAT